MKTIRIQAKCDRFEIDEQVSEKNAERRLRQLQSLFLYKKTGYVFKKKKFIGSDKLVVKTSVINPTLF